MTSIGTNTRSTARTAGALYLLMAVTGFFSIMYVRSQLVVAGDAAATAQNLAARETLFRLGLASDLVSQVVFVLLVFVLYRLLRSVHRGAAMLMVMFALAGIAIAMINSTNLVAAQRLAGGAGFLDALGPDSRQALTMLFLELHDHGISVAQIFWGLWLLPLGYLVYRADFLPALLGILLMIGCFGYLVATFVPLLLPGSGDAIPVGAATVSAVGEISFLGYLLARGSRNLPGDAT